ncbi:LysR family transcriptional regulator [Polyangium sp. 15x6]|uniref:LysR family transcriptional regulator n=1 Tax=Polyangium sp. 15x6 TaxID=3042687 RepID=UPI00249C3722|nr:LysR family transcriptional regulator [Polyangium sp. 15x6]MDI3283833.1 LysR family transcriptional regulator [Polyangium sp. 15x6]
MRREDWPDLAAFVTIAEERSFTRAAARLGVSTSALSHAMRALEDRLGVRLLSRTTRSVAPTAAGERLLATLKPAMDDVASAVESLDTLRREPAGHVRLTVHSLAMQSIAPRLPAFARAYPDVVVDITVDNTLTDIVANRFDAGVRYGELVDKDMISVRVGPDERGAVVASPAYFERFPPPKKPQDIARHRCLCARISPSGPIYRWELEKRGRLVRVEASPVFITNDADTLLTAALAGMGLAYVMESYALPHLHSGALVRVLEDWCPPFPGSFLYYPSRRQLTPALRALIEALRHPAPAEPRGARRVGV